MQKKSANTHKTSEWNGDFIQTETWQGFGPLDAGEFKRMKAQTKVTLHRQSFIPSLRTWNCVASQLNCWQYWELKVAQKLITYSVYATLNEFVEAHNIHVPKQKLVSFTSDGLQSCGPREEVYQDTWGGITILPLSLNIALCIGRHQQQKMDWKNYTRQ